MVVSGRRLPLGGVVDKVDSVVAAWLPGPAGEGVTDVLFGAQAHGQGLLHWAPQITLGYGLSY